MPFRAIDDRFKPRLRTLIPLVLAVGGQVITAAVAQAAENVTIPRYQPEIGTVHTYRIQKTTETDMSLWFDKPEAAAMVMRGDFRQQTAVVSRDDKGMRVRWVLSADLPPAALSVADSYPMNAQYRNSLTAYGVQQLEVETDLTGYPTALAGADQIVAHMESLIAAPGPGGATVPADSVASRMVQAIKDNPLKVVDVLIPEVIALSLGQASQDATIEVGSAWSAKGDESIGDGIVSATSAWKLVSTDSARRIATFSMLQSFDPAALQAATKAPTEKIIAGFGERAKQLTDEQMTRVLSPQKSRDLTLVVSLQDGSTVEALDSVTVDSAGTKLTIVAHIWRDDQLPTLPEPPAWKAKIVSAQSVSPLGQTTTQPSDLEGFSGEAKSGAPAEQQAAAEPPKAIAPISLKIAKAETTRDPLYGETVVSVVLTPDSAKVFGDFTRAAIGQKTQLLIGETVILEPVVREPILQGMITINGFDTTKAQGLAEQLSAPNAAITVRLAP
ncbi:hypothetical protein ACFWXH_22240 [Mesorhizobium sp. NPDC059054]|uniref:SecDF P1 head subdomain-containing protein n=1 Tax=Mesorhizobium sp. NPDC059054 TaxID=3346711 RepID=UPI0036BB7AC3